VRTLRTLDLPVHCINRYDRGEDVDLRCRGWTCIFPVPAHLQARSADSLKHSFPRIEIKF
jgi:hypothetical protein